ncbi:MAG: hypothetical protein IPM48_08750 [Saprospiraceae bacterium]|nr:hypothetical protein [Saprospiraceae bacterium]
MMTILKVYRVSYLFSLCLVLFLSVPNFVYSQDSSNLDRAVAKILRSIHALKMELESIRDQISYLETEKEEYTKKSDVRRMGELIQNKGQEIAVKEYKLQLFEILLSKARRLEYSPKAEQQNLLNGLEKEWMELDRRRIGFSEARNSKINVRMTSEIFPATSIYHCELNHRPDQNLIYTNHQYLFCYTPASIETHLTETELAIAEIAMLKNQKNVYLDFRLSFSTSMAAKIYGLFEANNPVKLSFSDASFIYLYAAHSTAGEINPVENQCIYHFQFLLDDFRINELQNKLADQMTIIWEKGKEVFEIHQMDLFQNQIKCLKQ